VLSAEPFKIAHVVVTTDFAATTGAISAIFLAYAFTRKWDVSMAFNGALAGLVAITGGALFVTPMAALVIGTIAGTIAFFGVQLLEKLRIDDPVGAFPVHGLNGMFGILAVGIWGVDGVGLLSGGGFTQLGIQALGIVACVAWAFPLSLGLFAVLKRTIGLRVSAEVEATGLDFPQHGLESYPEFDGVELRGIQARDWGLDSAPLPADRGAILAGTGD
jgi:Amt family ammonium transporter